MIKKTIIVVLLNFITFSSYSQEAPSLLNNRFEVGVGLLYAKVGYEQKLTNKLSVVGSLNYNMSYQNYNGYSETYSIGSIKVEPRWYYNIEKRKAKGKNIKNNSANYFALEVEYLPKAMATQKFIDYHTLFEYAINYSTTYNIKRNIGQSNFGYEYGFGLGITHLKERYHPRYDYKHNDLVILLKIGLNYSIK